MEKKSFEEIQSMSFDEKCDWIRKTALTRDMSYEERLEMQKIRYGL